MDLDRPWWHWPAAGFGVWLIATFALDPSGGGGAIGRQIGAALAQVIKALAPFWPVAVGLLVAAVTAPVRARRSAPAAPRPD